MDIRKEIIGYLESLPQQKRKEIETLDNYIRELLPDCELWFLDGKDSDGKTVSNPSIGYGTQTLRYQKGKSKKFYQIGISANARGISIYIMGLKDRTYLSKKYSQDLPKASITGYCIKFKTLMDIDIVALKRALVDGINCF
ncbi:DUF1801 domain-containing protein [Pedobacter duraquae]|uniref:YdhG-like domain-containing protein n=1 Tax=Pedobacter duraquae TaxID=425511 RepID=A0A4R6IFT7_9SPHI|nr:DUF1801 domain-containing protein [Pedobacter duraquae]TDO20914.1 hypothetical protein CLV32_3550 [Pedobacter duraquae]